MIKPLLIAIAFLLALPNFYGTNKAVPSLSYNGKEKFSPNLSFISSAAKLEKFVDAAAISRNISFQSLAYAELLDNTVSCRFYNGYSGKTLQEDWVAVAMDKCFSTHLSFITLADDILQQPNAGAAQQNLVMAEILKRKKITSKNIEPGGHPAIGANIGGVWYFFDAAREPLLKGNQRILGPGLLATQKILNAYEPAIRAEILCQQGSAAAKSSVLISTSLQSVTGILSKTLWVFSLLMLWVVRKRKFKLYAIRPTGKYAEMFPMQPAFNA